MKHHRFGIGAFSGALLITLSLSIANPAVSQTADSENSQTEKSQWYELNMMVDPIADQALLFFIAMTYSGQADIGECLETASRIDTSDPDSWPREWTATAERFRDLAVSAEKKGHTVSAGELYLRSATYYTAALQRHNDSKAPMVVENARAASDLFRKALKLMNVPMESVDIPYENTTLPGYFFRSPLATGPAPVLIVHQGRDAWAIHDLYLAEAAMKRGYHCLLFDGPGQGEALRLQNLIFRHDWEKVVTPIVDYVMTRDDVDPDRIGLMGLSMGGSLAPRAAIYEKRLKVCVANPGVMSWPDICDGYLAQSAPHLAGLWKTDPDQFNAQIAELMAQVPFWDWGIRDMMWKFGSKSPAHWMAQMEDHYIRDIVSEIDCKMLIMDGPVDDWTQAREMYDSLKCEKDFIQFSAEDTGLLHCQVGAQAISSERLFDWLEENL